MERNLMNYDFNEDDEVLDASDSAHEERDDDVRLGKKIAREKRYHALVGGALKTTPLDDNCVTSEPAEYKSDAEAIIEHDLPSAKDADEDDTVLDLKPKPKQKHEELPKFQPPTLCKFYEPIVMVTALECE